MWRNTNRRLYYTNLQTKFSNCVLINADMIIAKKQSDFKVSQKTGEVKVKYDYSVNKDFWQAQPKPLIVAIDEAHSVLNSRKSMSQQNIVISDWLSLIRRVVNSNTQEGELILITQFLHKLDTNAREMATQIRYHICHYWAVCHSCHVRWKETSEFPKDLKKDFCPRCGRETIREGHQIEVYHFSSIDDYYNWFFNKVPTHYAHYKIKRGVSFFFDKYDTLQWENMFGNYN